MRFVYAHFPINVQLTNGDRTVEVRNFLGERRVRVIDLIDGVTATRSSKVKDQLELEGNDIDDVALCCTFSRNIFFLHMHLQLVFAWLISVNIYVCVCVC